jgi:hypothetical protein
LWKRGHSRGPDIYSPEIVEVRTLWMPGKIQSVQEHYIPRTVSFDSSRKDLGGPETESQPSFGGVCCSLISTRNSEKPTARKPSPMPNSDD